MFFIRKKLKYLFSDLNYIFTKQRFRLLFLKRKLKIFEYNDKNNSIYYNNNDYIKSNLHSKDFFDKLKIGEPINIITGDSDNINTGFRFNRFSDYGPISESADNKLMDYTSYFDNLLNSELVQSIPNLSSSGHLSISNILGHSIKNKNFYKKKYKNLDTLGFIDKKTNIIKNNILDISSKKYNPISDIYGDYDRNYKKNNFIGNYFFDNTKNFLIWQVIFLV
jgi:hypothetical protein